MILATIYISYKSKRAIYLPYRFLYVFHLYYTNKHLISTPTLTLKSIIAT